MSVSNLPVGFRFGVFFFTGGRQLNPVDIRFRRVSGLGATVSMKSHAEGGQNLFAHRLPETVQYENLVLERGVALQSPLYGEIRAALSRFEFTTSNVLVTPFNDTGQPIAGWLFLRAFPVHWSVSDLDAENNSLIIERIELAYARMQIMEV